MNVRKKILIVDDSEMNRSLLEDMLSGDFDIIEAENGMEAAGILHNQSHEICLMLLDIVMPVMDGFGLLDLMNKNGWIKHVPVIMISAETVPTYVERAYDLGVLDFINRPFDVRIVQRRVASAIMLVAKRNELAQMVVNQVYEKEKDSRLMIEILSNLVEFRNGDSGLHVLHIQVFTEQLLKRLLVKTDRYPMNHRDISFICNAAALHDIGKIAVPPEILNKPGRLTPEEFEIMKTHSAEGAKILSSVPVRETEPLIQYGYQICRWHHERYDGRGYPDGLKGEDIPIAAQVVALADVYDALTSNRVYKPAFSHEEAVQMILEGQCGTFNPLLLECLTDISDQLKKESSDLSLGRHSEKDLLNSVEQMMEMSKMDVSEKSLRLLEHERMKYQFFADLSKEIQFEYMAAIPELLILSEWGAKYLGMPESILNPRNEDFGTKVFSKEDFSDLLESLKHTTPESPVIEKKYLLNINGSHRWSKVICRSTWVEKETPEYTGAIGKIVDIHDDVEQVKELREQSDRDSLTGLLNHQAAKRKITPILESGQKGEYALLMFDVDDFKHINDHYGHLFGDEILRAVAERMKNSIRSSDIAARMGGDEFVIFAAYKKTVGPLVERVFSHVTELYKDYPVSISMGVACLGADTDVKDYDALFKMADETMYEVKRGGGKGYRYYGGKVI